MSKEVIVFVSVYKNNTLNDTLSFIFSKIG